jgi:branched-chain amino acid transport system permease protein
VDLVVATSTNFLILSSMYILVALGFAFLFNMLRILNLAHGAIYMVGGYVGLSFILMLGLNQWISLLLTVLIIAAFGVFLERFCFRPFVGDFNRVVMVCVAIAVILQTAVNIIAGTKTLALPPFVEGVFEAGPVLISNERIVTFAIGAIFLGLVIWFVNRTKWGQQMQAIAQDTEGAYLQGINVHRISALACFIGCGLAALAGCMMGAYLRLGPYMGDLMLIKALILVIMAGVGSISGTLVTGLVLGALDAALPVLVPGAASDAITVGIVIVILIIRPQGFFGYEIEI